jgi:FtsP/CotA-like multicopper oxidase with cupredoxin domain
MVNGRSYPNVESDSTSKIMGMVGDTIQIQVANTGQAVHSIHFHGYHFRVLYSSKSAVHHDWIKDTMPMHPMHTMILELVPDKPGMYPVHDHNLISVTGGGIYPYGLMLMIDIQ